MAMQTSLFSVLKTSFASAMPGALLVLAMLLHQPTKVQADPPILTPAARALLLTELNTLRDGDKVLHSGFNGAAQFTIRQTQMHDVLCKHKENYALDGSEGFKGDGVHWIQLYETVIKKELKSTTSGLFSVFSRTDNRVTKTSTPSFDEKVTEAKSVACQWCGVKKTIWNDKEFHCDEAK